MGATGFDLVFQVATIGHLYHGAMVRRAFTLVEVLVVIGVIGLLVGLMMPVFSRVRAESDSTRCTANLRQLFAGLQALRQQQHDLLPFAAPLPVPANPTALPGSVPDTQGLPQHLSRIIPEASNIWLCPSDETVDSQLLGTSYVYVPGAFMLLELPMANLSVDADRQRISRLITERFQGGYLRAVPVLADNGDHHDVGNREPRNAVFIDGHAGAVRKTATQVAPPGVEP